MSMYVHVAAAKLACSTGTTTSSCNKMTCQITGSVFDMKSYNMTPQLYLPWIVISCIYRLYKKWISSFKGASFFPMRLAFFNTVYKDCYDHQHLFQMKILAKKIITNEHGGPLATLQISPETPVGYWSLGSIVVHVVTVLLFRNKADILMPFHRILHHPSSLIVSCCTCTTPSTSMYNGHACHQSQAAYLPTMPEGVFPGNKVAPAECGLFFGNK